MKKIELTTKENTINTPPNNITPDQTKNLNISMSSSN